jgi:DNA (cytosine-5)-methyltransferase 1
LNDDRGNLTLVFTEIADAIDNIRARLGAQPAIIFWENVPGVLSTRDNAFGNFLAKLVGESIPLDAPGKRWPNAGIVVGPQRSAAWRVLDAQYFGLAQRRKRVFVVASARDDIDIGQVLFEFEGMQRYTAPCRETELQHTGSVANSTGEYCETLAFKFRSQGFCTGEKNGVPNPKVSGGHGFLFSPERTFTIATTRDQHILWKSKRNEGVRIAKDQNTVPTLTSFMGTGGGNVPLYGVRQLTPRECERLQGFPDDYTLIPYRGKLAADGPRYHALGNSWAVPVVRWIGSRIDTMCNQ